MTTRWRRYRDALTVSWIVTGYWILTLSLVWWPPWAEIPWLFTSFIGSAGRWLVRRRGARRGAAAS